MTVFRAHRRHAADRVVKRSHDPQEREGCIKPQPQSQIRKSSELAGKPEERGGERGEWEIKLRPLERAQSHVQGWAKVWFPGSVKMK